MSIVESQQSTEKEVSADDLLLPMHIRAPEPNAKKKRSDTAMSASEGGISTT